MTLDDADILLAQWAQWAENELRKLGHSASRWQMDYRSGFVDEAPESEIPAGDDKTMLDIDIALAALKTGSPHHFRVLQGRYVRRLNYTYLQLEAAKRAFIAYYQSPIDICAESRLTMVHGRSCL
jgi:hypothetical protein